VYVDSAGFPTTRRPNNGNPVGEQPTPAEPLTDFQRLVRDSTKETLPLFGRELFRLPASTFAPAEQIPVTPDYLLGPGDEIVLRIWGHTNFNGRLTVDRSGSIYVPQVGAVHVSGLRYGDLQKHIEQDLARTFRNFEMSVNLGQLRSIQVFVLGEAQHPGSYTVSSLSTAFNALLTSGGPTVKGSLRAVRIQRAGQTLGTIDLYDFALRGDKSKDVVLQDGDVVFIPVVGPMVAVSGSVRRPAIYEVLPGSTGTVADLLNLAGGRSSTATGSRISLERIVDHHDRRAINVGSNSVDMSMPVADGDVLHVDSVLADYRDSVTIRGNLANAGRFPWTPGMKLTDIIPERDALLTNDYWKRRNKLGTPTPMFEALPEQRGRFDPRGQTAEPQGQFVDTRGLSVDPRGRPNSNSRTPVDQTDLREEDVEQTASAAAGRRDNLRDATQELDRSSLADLQFAASRNMASSSRKNDISIPTPEIDWSYAVIERLNPSTLRPTLIPFRLGSLVLNHDMSQNLPLEPGDIVTILSQSDLQVSQDESTKYVRIEGEVVSSGVYSVEPNETLRDVVRKAGGLTSKAYLFGATFSRESARVMQQQRLDEYVSSLSLQLDRSSLIRTVSATNPLQAGAGLDTQKALIQQLRGMRATGRVVLEFAPSASGMDVIPDLPLENGDTFRIPSRPLVVSVVGAVYGPNVYLYNGTRRVEDYLKLAGKPTQIADTKRSFVIRADGSIFSRSTKGGMWSEHFERALVYPGDTIVIPEKPVKPSVLRDVIDWSQVFSQFAIGAAAIQVIK
jgi:protein involved in polysaccharide export with SLBB domain